jgi:hypothetical protein
MKVPIVTQPTLQAQVLPAGMELTDEELAEVEGKFWPFLVARAVGAATGVASNAAYNVIQGKPWHDGIVGAAVTTTIVPVPTNTVIRRVGSGLWQTERTVNWAGVRSNVGWSAAGGIAGGAAERAFTGP